MTPITIVLAAFLVGLALMSFLFINPIIGAIFTVIVGGFAIFLEVGRRSRARPASDEVSFTQRDRETLYESDTGATERGSPREEAGATRRS